MLNVDPDNKDGFSTRQGCTLALSGAAHSGWDDGKGNAYLVKGGYLCSFNGTATTNLIAVNPTLKMAFEPVNDVIVASNGQDYIIIDNGSAYYATPSTAEFRVSPPAGRYLAFYNGRLYIARDNVICCTVPFSVDECDERQMRIPLTQDTITGLVAVDNGLFVGTTTEAFFLAGIDAFAEGGFQITRVADYGVTHGTMKKSIAENMQVTQFPGTVAVWAGKRGFCAGGNGGAFKNLSVLSVSIPVAEDGASMVREQNGQTHFVAVLDSNSTFNAYNQPVFDLTETEL
jgi:hypothetical protein